jgi:hypothetical protein
MPITKTQLEDFLASYGVFPVQRKDKNGQLVEGYLYSDIEMACRKAGLSPQELAPFSQNPSNN